MQQRCYLLDMGILLPPEDEEYENYSNVYDKQHGFYDEDQSYTTNLAKAIQEALDYVTYGVENTYAVISEKYVNDSLTETDIRSKTVKNETYDMEDVLFSLQKKDGKVIPLMTTMVQKSQNIEPEQKAEFLGQLMDIVETFITTHHQELKHIENPEEFVFLKDTSYDTLHESFKTMMQLWNIIPTDTATKYLVYEKNYLSGGDVDTVDAVDMKLWATEAAAKQDMLERKAKYCEEKNTFTFMENESSDVCFVFADGLIPETDDRSGEFHICMQPLEENKGQ